MMNLRSHASSHGTKDDIGQPSRDMCSAIDFFGISQAGCQVTATREDLQTVGATNESNIILVQPQSIMLANYQRSG